MAKTIVISAFPACGKSYCYNNFNGKPYVMLDSDSSKFSWEKDADGNNTDVRNKDFPQNYIDHIQHNLDKVDIIFVSSHEIVRRAMDDAGIKYYTVIPDIHMKSEWISRMKERDNTDEFIKLLDENFEQWVADIIQEPQYHHPYIHPGALTVLDKSHPYIDMDLLNILTAYRYMDVSINNKF